MHKAAFGMLALYTQILIINNMCVFFCISVELNKESHKLTKNKLDIYFESEPEHITF